MKTGLIFLTILILTIGLWLEIGAMTLIILPVALIFMAAAVAPFIGEPAEPIQTNFATAVPFAVASAD